MTKDDLEKGECIVNLLELHRMVGQRVMLVLLELVAGMEINGRSTVNWMAFCRRTGMDRSNLAKLLHTLEDGGLIIREVDKRGNLVTTYDSVWVNPGMLRHAYAKRAFAPNQIRAFMTRRGRFLDAKKRAAGPPELDPGEDLP